MAKKKLKAIPKNPKVYEFTITLKNTSPRVWRKILAHEFIELTELHMLIQMSMGWHNSHLYSFDINGKSYSDAESAEEMDMTSTDGLLLCEILGSTKKFSYTYDFGDDWVHDIEISKVLDHDQRINYPVCIDGENACPPEDCGGAHGFEELKKTLSGKESEQKDEMLTWVGGFYNPKTFDPNFVNKHFFWADI